MKLLKIGDTVNHMGQLVKVGFVYLTSKKVQFAHLTNGIRNIATASLEQFEETQNEINNLIPQEDKKMKVKINKQELESLTVEELNIALGGKYSKEELKTKTSGFLIEEYEATQKPAKKARKSNPLVEYINKTVENESLTRKQLIELCVTEFPDKSLKGIKYTISNGKNEKYNRLKSLLKENKETGILSF